MQTLESTSGSRMGGLFRATVDTAARSRTASEVVIGSHFKGGLDITSTGVSVRDDWGRRLYASVFAADNQRVMDSLIKTCVTCPVV